MQKILIQYSSFDLRFVCLAPALMGVLLVMFGCAYEASGQATLLSQYGANALAAYQATVAMAQLSTFDEIWTGLSNSSVTMSGAIQAYGFVLVFFVTPLCPVSMLLARTLVGRSAFKHVVA